MNQLGSVLLLCLLVSFQREGVAASTRSLFENGLAQPLKEVETTYGAVRGFQDGQTMKFLGVPYASPPVDELRFEAAEEPESWHGTVLDATSYGASCPQSCDPQSDSSCPESEDCLFLNIYTPVGEPPEEGWPVFVWIHGGAFVGGSGSSPTFPGESFAENGIILVTLNYRLGALGWLNYGDIEGNFGLSDQRMALSWVQDNIRSFGGDKDAVTVGGESAGAMAILVHLASPSVTEGLFSKAIVESGTIALPYNKPTGPDSKNKNTFYKELMKNAGCPQHRDDYVQCMRDLSVNELLDATAEMMDKKANLVPFLSQPADLVEPFYPVINTQDVPLSPLEAFEKGEFNKVPLIMGNNADEGDLFVDTVFGSSKVDKLVEMPAMLSVVFGLEDGLKIRNLYPLFGKTSGSSREILSNITTDYFFTGSTHKVASLFNKHDVPVYTYLFDYVQQLDPTTATATDLAMLDVGAATEEACKGKVCHGDEIPFVFNTFSLLSDKDDNQEDQKVADAVSSQWRNFIKSEEDKEIWPPHTKDKKQWLVIGDEPRGLEPGAALEDPVEVDELEVVKSPLALSGRFPFEGKKLRLWDKIGYDLWPNKI